jgi:uncharacterized protein YggE
MRNGWIKYFVTASFFLILSQVAAAQESNKITVTGEAEVFRKPDVAYITLYSKQHGVLTVDAVSKAKDKVEEIRRVVTQTHSDILETEITDVRLGERVSRMYRPDEESPPTPEVVTQIRITVKPNPEIVHKIIDAAIRAGALMQTSMPYSAPSQNLGVVVYGLSNYEEAYNEAQKQAIMKSKAEAQRIAELIDRKVGRVLSVNAQKSSIFRGAQMANPYPTDFVGASPEKVRIVATVSVQHELQ